MAFFIVDTKLNIMKLTPKAVQDIVYHNGADAKIITNTTYTMFQKELVSLLRKAKAEEEKNV